MNKNEITAEEILERSDRLAREMTRLRNAFKAILEGVPFTEAFDEEVYLEGTQEKKSSEKHLARMIEHLLKLKYCTNDRNNNTWVKEIRNHKDEVIDITRWEWKKKETIVINYLKENLQEIYEQSITWYKKDAKEYTDLRDGLDWIPEECPWTLEKLLDDDIDELLEKLPMID